jgi:hypothetical protein
VRVCGHVSVEDPKKFQSLCAFPNGFWTSVKVISEGAVTSAEGVKEDADRVSVREE